MFSGDLAGLIGEALTSDTRLDLAWLSPDLNSQLNRSLKLLGILRGSQEISLSLQRIFVYVSEISGVKSKFNNCYFSFLLFQQLSPEFCL